MIIWLPSFHGKSSRAAIVLFPSDPFIDRQNCRLETGDARPVGLQPSLQSDRQIVHHSMCIGSLTTVQEEVQAACRASRLLSLRLLLRQGKHVTLSRAGT